MTDKDYAPLSSACVRALSDKLYEKRKTAALEVDRMVRDFVNVNNVSGIERLLRLLGHDFINSTNVHMRKGGLIGLASMAVALGSKNNEYIVDLAKPVLGCLSDSDSRVRYYACEALYNVVKVGRHAVLPLFTQIFNVMAVVAADPDQNVKTGSEMVDKLLKDIVTESSSFDLVAFIPVLRERVYSTNPFARQFIVNWVSVLDSVPDINMLIFLPELLDGLFLILGDPNKEIKKSCETVLAEFLHAIIRNPNEVDFSAMTNILITHAQSEDPYLKLTALIWLKEFVALSGAQMIPYSSGLLTAVLPRLHMNDNSSEDLRKEIHEIAKAVNYSLMQLISKEHDGEEEAGEMALLRINSIMEVLESHLENASLHTKMAVLRWIYHLHNKVPCKMKPEMNQLFPLLMSALKDAHDEVVLLSLEVIAEISSSNHMQVQLDIIQQDVPDDVVELVKNNSNINAYFVKFMMSLLDLFKTQPALLEDRGSFIIRQLCVFLDAECIYRTLSGLILVGKLEEDVCFASIMVQTLNTILLTSSELYQLRSKLKNYTSSGSDSLFMCLYKSWCHHPVAVIALCLLTQHYEHALSIIQQLGDMEVTVDFLTEIDKLVQLLESPIFTYVRLQLLDPRQHALVSTLYGLLMMLPQSEIFEKLRKRLDCIPKTHLQFKNEENACSTRNKPYPELLEYFSSIQEEHRKARHAMHPRVSQLDPELQSLKQDK